MPEAFLSFVELAAKASKYCTEIPPGQQQYLPGETPALLQLNRFIFEGAVEIHSSGLMSVLEEPVQSRLENLFSSSFLLVILIYLHSMRYSPGLNMDAARSAGLELLNVMYRAAEIFRRSIAADNSEKCYQTSASAALRIVAVSVRSFMDLGKVADPGGESAIRLLNTSWKSITGLLQIEKGRDAVASAIHIEDIIKYLICTAVNEMKRVLGTQPSEASAKGARKHCILIKYFLTTAVRISSFYPRKAILISSELAMCLCKLFACLVCKDLDSQNEVKESLVDLVVPTACSLLQDLVHGQGVAQEEKIQLLVDMSSSTEDMASSPSLDEIEEGSDTVNEIFCGMSSQSPASGALKCGRVVLFLSLLTAAGSYSPPLLSHLVSRLPWLMDQILEEDLYVLMTHKMYLPDLGTNEQNVTRRWKYQLTFPWMTTAIKVFAATAAKYEEVWVDFERFLFKCALHPCVMCAEAVLDVWSFIIRKSAPKLAQSHLSSLLVLLQSSVSQADSPLSRRLARALCWLLREAPSDVVSSVSEAAFRGPFDSRANAEVATLLLEERFPLSDLDLQLLVSKCIADAKRLTNDLLSPDCTGRVPPEVTVQMSALFCLPLLLSMSAGRECGIEDRHTKEITTLVQDLISLYNGDLNNAEAFHTIGVVNPMLELIPHVQHLLNPKLFEVLLPTLLRTMSNPPHGSRCLTVKQPLAELLANLSEIGFSEDESYPPMQALWGLYHSVLGERKWALIHMGLESFAHFADRTSFQELWRFVPSDAGVVGNVVCNEDAFMAELEDFLEKRCARTSLDVPERELNALRRECKSERGQQKNSL